MALRRSPIVFSSGHLITKKDIDKLERVQRRGTKIIRRLKGLTWKRRLKELNMDNSVKQELSGNNTIIIYKQAQEANTKNLTIKE